MFSYITKSKKGSNMASLDPTNTSPSYQEPSNVSGIVMIKGTLGMTGNIMITNLKNGIFCNYHSPSSLCSCNGTIGFPNFNLMLII